MTPSRRFAGALAVPCAVLGLAGCAKTIKRSDVESKITQNIAGQLKGRKVTVKCPGGQTAEKGTTFTCDAVIGADKAVVDVRLLDDKGTFTFRLRSAAKP